MVVRSEKTAQIYALQVKKARDNVAPGSSGYDFLLETEKVVAYVEAQNWSINTKKMAYIAFKSVLRDCNDPRYKGAEAKYEERMYHYRDKHNEIASQQQLSEREKELYLPWQKIVGAAEGLRVGVSSLWEFQEWVVFCLYTLAPPLRLDYSPMRVVETRQEVADTSGNLLLVSEWKFILREYKTASKYGQMELDIQKPLREVLREWLDLNPSGWLLMNRSGQPLAEKELGNLIREVMLKATGKAIGCNILRHSYISHQRKGEKTLLEQQKMAAAMGHSVGMSQIYRRL